MIILSCDFFFDIDMMWIKDIRYMISTLEIESLSKDLARDFNSMFVIKLIILVRFVIVIYHSKWE